MCGIKLFKGAEKASYGLKDPESAKVSTADIPGLDEETKISTPNETYKKIKNL